MFGRRAKDDDVVAAVSLAYAHAPREVLDAVLGSPGRPRRDAVGPWVDEQVLREAARRCAGDAGPTSGSDPGYPPDGDEALRVYLPDDLADDETADVAAALWAQARAEAWGDHADALRSERELWWAQDVLAGPVAALVASWRA